MSRGYKWICFDVIIRVPKSIRSVNNKEREKQDKKEESEKILNVKIRIERDAFTN
jgi:hypothetical protein